MPKYKLIFDVETSTSEYKIYRVFETESENLARDEALQMEWQLCHPDAKVLFEKVEVINSRGKLNVYSRIVQLKKQPYS